MRRLLVPGCFLFVAICTTSSNAAVGQKRQRRHLVAQDECFNALAMNDVNEDDRINRPEYVAVVNDLSNRTWSNVTSYSQLPDSLQSVFVNLYFNTSSPGSGISFDVYGSKPGQMPTPTQQLFLSDQVCPQITGAIETLLNPASNETASPSSSPAPSAPPTVSPSAPPFNFNSTSTMECFSNLTLSDTDKNSLLGMSEYVGFVNLWNDTLGIMAFEELPLLLRANFHSLASEKSNVFDQYEADINIVGAYYPNQTTTVEQYEFLTLICSQTRQVLSVVLDMTPTAAPSMAPVPTLVPTGTLAPSRSPAPTTSFEPTTAPSTSPQPTTEPNATPNDLILLECLFALGLSDENENEELNRTEYVTFLNFRSDLVFVDYGSLPSLLQVNYDALASQQNSTVIPIEGYNDFPEMDIPQTQLEYLQLVCRQTDVLLSSLEGLQPPPTPITTFAPTLQPSTRSPTTAMPITSAPTSAPPTFGTRSPTAMPTTSAPTSAPPTFGTGSPTAMPTTLPPTPMPTVQVQIVSSFGISNTVGLTAENVVGTLVGNDLQDAYDMTAIDVVVARVQNNTRRLSRGRRRRRRRRRRRLDEVDYVVNSGTIDNVTDMACPSFVESGSTCQSVSASFLVAIDNQDNEESVKSLYTADMDAAIRNGDLQDNLVSDSPLLIFVDGQEEKDDDSSNSDGMRIIIICLSVWGAAVLIVGLTVFAGQRRRARNKITVDGHYSAKSLHEIQGTMMEPVEQRPPDDMRVVAAAAVMSDAPPSKFGEMEQPMQNGVSAYYASSLPPGRFGEKEEPMNGVASTQPPARFDEVTCASADIILYDDSLSQVLEQIDREHVYMPPIEGSVSSDEASEELEQVGRGIYLAPLEASEASESDEDWSPPFKIC